MRAAFFSLAYDALCVCDVDAKVRAATVLSSAFDRDGAQEETTVIEVLQAGRPPRPPLVSPLKVARFPMNTTKGRAALIHSLAHIEFNAINLALDAIYRFRGLPSAYYADWAGVAQEEAHHFSLLRTHLKTLGFDYGDFEAHDGLWEMARATAHDPLVRMALVPRVLEARGLDAMPALTEKLRSTGDTRAMDILKIIERDEIGHVAIGTRWFHWLCAERGLDADDTFIQLVHDFGAPRVRPPFARAARIAAGFNETELDRLEKM